MRGWRALGLFWVTLLALVGGGAATLQRLGPLPHAAPAVGEPVALEPARHGVSPPVAALLEPSRFPPMQLPKVAADGRRAAAVYAAPAPVLPPGMPRVALLVAGYGMAERESRAVIDELPAAVSVAVSAYASASALAEAARAAGHELWASVPMESTNYPLIDAGPRSLLTGASPEDNRINLEWALSRTPGAVGATAASDSTRGERFSDMAGAFGPVRDEIARRGLLFLDARAGRGSARAPFSRQVDIVLDDPLSRAEFEAKLVAMERMARDRGAALGLVAPPRPFTTERLAAWIKTLPDKGIALVPVSALPERP